ncbi:hypothetical protein F5Y16DRAFT_420988 [Xylariaceae sp. FL0255]|nr:hypothetical protein F5Y16DRAFT_420988 [Xylariaceae sp. FL0255]
MDNDEPAPRLKTSIVSNFNGGIIHESGDAPFALYAFIQHPPVKGRESDWLVFDTENSIFDLKYGFAQDLIELYDTTTKQTVPVPLFDSRVARSSSQALPISGSDTLIVLKPENRRARDAVVQVLFRGSELLRDVIKLGHEYRFQMKSTDLGIIPHLATQIRHPNVSSHQYSWSNNRRSGQQPKLEGADSEGNGEQHFLIPSFPIDGFNGPTRRSKVLAEIPSCTNLIAREINVVDDISPNTEMDKPMSRGDHNELFPDTWVCTLGAKPKFRRHDCIRIAPNNSEVVTRLNLLPNRIFEQKEGSGLDSEPDCTKQRFSIRLRPTGYWCN